MKAIITALGLFLLSTASFAETVLILHAQQVPASVAPGFQSELRNSLVEKVFDFCFNRGDIAFDTSFSLDEGVPSATWLGAMSGRYGADRVICLQVVWKAGADAKAALDHLDYQVLNGLGQVERQGRLTAPLTCGEPDEAKIVEGLGNQVVDALKS